MTRKNCDAENGPTIDANTTVDKGFAASKHGAGSPAHFFSLRAPIQ